MKHDAVLVIDGGDATRMRGHADNLIFLCVFSLFCSCLLPAGGKATSNAGSSPDVFPDCVFCFSRENTLRLWLNSSKGLRRRWLLLGRQLHSVTLLTQLPLVWRQQLTSQKQKLTFCTSLTPLLRSLFPLPES